MENVVVGEKKSSSSKKLPVENSINEHIFRNIRDKTCFLVLCKIHTKMVSVCLKIKSSKIHPVIYQLRLSRISSNVACYGLDEVLHIVDGLFLGLLCAKEVFIRLLCNVLNAPCILFRTVCQ